MTSRSRRSRAFAGLAVALLAPVGVLVATSTNSSAASSDVYAVAPYVDLTNNQEPMLDKAISQAGLKAFTAAFVIGGGCTPIWGDTLPAANDPTVEGEISKATQAGAQVIVSFGGASGTELAQSCTDQSQVTSGYQSVIDKYHLNHIDFDVEGAAIADTASLNRRFQAINSLESANPGLVVSVTIPVAPDGPDYNGQAFLQSAKSNGTRIDLVNIMTMDYYGSWDNNPTMGAYSTQAAKATLDFVKKVWPSDSYANIGITPMIGQNDDAREVFSTADAQAVVDFANANGIGRLAFWSVDRDQPCSSTATGLSQCTQIGSQPLDFTKIFGQYAGGSAPPTTTTTTTTTTQPPGGNLVSNAGFENGSLSPWACDAGTASVVTSPTHSGSYALSAGPTNSVTGQCSQTIAVQPGHTYTLSAWVRGNYAYIGETTTGANTWTPSATDWTKLSTTFTTGANTSSATVYVHGWYGQGTVYADDFSLG